jgi:predicted dehydrogenase
MARITHAATISPRARSWKATIVGHTGQGDYGHGFDLLFTNVSNVVVLAIADPDAAGRERGRQRSRAKRQYEDYRQMLRLEQPELVVIAPRWTIRHHEIAMAALQGGAHVLLEKPFATTLAEADEIITSARKMGKKVAVAHQIRLAPSIKHLQRAMVSGVVGELKQIRSWGKQDARAGGEDMMVLGTHLFDLIRLFAGDPLWCSARALHEGGEITRQHARRVRDDVGLVAGDEIEAQFGFGNGILATFTSRATLRETLGPWGMELLGTRGIVRILADVVPRVLVRKRGTSQGWNIDEQWGPLPDDPTINYNAEERGFGPANRHLLDDWLDAIANDRDPQCSDRNAMKALEMVMAVYEAALLRSRVTFPLENRRHPLAL